jgi:hypothetical protein
LTPPPFRLTAGFTDLFTHEYSALAVRQSTIAACVKDTPSTAVIRTGSLTPHPLIRPTTGLILSPSIPLTPQTDPLWAFREKGFLNRFFGFLGFVRSRNLGLITNCAPIADWPLCLMVRRTGRTEEFGAKTPEI